MTSRASLSLCGFELPLDELVPGFLVPVFFLADDMVVQRIGEGMVCLGDKKIHVTDKYLAISTLRQVGNLTLELLRSTPLSIGDAALYAFFDGQRIYVGSQAQLRARLAHHMQQLGAILRDRPFTLASLYEFVGDAKMADRLRKERSVAAVLSVSEFPSNTSHSDVYVAALGEEQSSLPSHVDEAVRNGLHRFRKSLLASRQVALRAVRLRGNHSVSARNKSGTSLGSVHA